MPSKDWKGVSGLAKGSFAKGSPERVVLPPLVINTCIDLVVAGDKLFLGKSPAYLGLRWGANQGIFSQNHCPHHDAMA